MKDIETLEKSRDVIRGEKYNRETMYYTALFGFAALAFLVVFIRGICIKNTGLIVYSAILCPLFTLAALLVLRLTLVSKDQLYVEDGYLVIKTFTVTRRIAIYDIGKVSAATNEKTNVTSVKINYGRNNTVKYKYKNFTKEEIAHLKRATSRY